LGVVSSGSGQNDGVLSVNLVANPVGKGSLLRTAGPFLLMVAVAYVIGVVGTVFLHLPQVVLLGMMWLVSGAGAVVLLRAVLRKPPVMERLRIQGNSVTWLNAKDETIITECTLDALAVERARYTVTTRYSGSEQLCLILRFPSRQTLYFGLNDAIPGIDARFVHASTGPALVVARADWDALLRVFGG
jgi:hypothetical protein